ncbi:MAG: 50S ribosomal protein L23 [Bacteroidales bacterium]|jgi:large subunit ribosomal protein L23|nr:50S ribosomal protein L23 [Bacteroidales bacterium]
MKTSLEILLKPVLTEKMTSQEEKLNRYGFLVERTANKLQIRKAIEEMYGVTVVSVNTMRYAGKNKSRFTKSGVISGKSNAYKKAVVTVKEGEKIDFYSNI